MPEPQRPRSAIVVADGNTPSSAVVARYVSADDKPVLVVAADGGLRRARALGLEPDVLVGDGDSLDQAEVEAARAAGLEVVLHRPDKDQSDTELAVQLALERGAQRIVVLGALGGGRFDHALANLLLLTLPELRDREVVIVDPAGTVRLLSDGQTLRLAAADGSIVSLLPLSPVVAGVRTHGLRFALAGDDLVQGPSRGLSNELVGEADISIDSGRLAVIQVHTGDQP